MTVALHASLSLRETLALLATVEHEPQSRYRWGSPCRFVRTVDIAVHILLPEALEHVAPSLAGYLRRTSPRWGKAWRDW